MTGPREPQIDIGSVRNLVCRRHEAALAADPTVNSIAFPIKVFEAAVADERTIVACQGETARIGPFLQSIAPVCEWISTEKVQWAWSEAQRLGRGGTA